MELTDLLGRFKWHIVIICIALAIVIFLGLQGAFETSDVDIIRQLVLMMGTLIFLSALLAMLSRVFKILDALRNNSTKLEDVTKALEKIHEGLTQINQSTRVSEIAKSIAFRDADRQSLRQAVFEKLQQQDFESATEIIEEINKRPEYKDLAEELNEHAEKYRLANEQERVNQSVAHIEELLESHRWVQASARIEELIKSYPDHEEVKTLRQKLTEKKEQRKKELLSTWDDAVKRKQTDYSLEILKELDMYLTPNEALALQETAKDVFRTKLYNLGTQFSIAVSERRWDEALEIGQRIVNDFPNSKMAEQIRGKMDVLRQNVQLQNSY